MNARESKRRKSDSDEGESFISPSYKNTTVEILEGISYRQKKENNTSKDTLSRTAIGIKSGNRYKLLNTLTKKESAKLKEQKGIEISPKVETKLGAGSEGTVSFAKNKNKNRNRNRNKNTFVAVKIIEKSEIVGLYEPMLRLYEKFNRLNTEGLLLPLDIIKQKNEEDKDCIYLFSPLSNLGNGENLYKFMLQLSSSERNVVLIHVAKSLLSICTKLHALSVYPLDINLENLLITSDGEIYFADLNCAFILDKEEGIFSMRGNQIFFNQAYASPECLFGSTAFRKLGLAEKFEHIDNWQIGLVLASLVSSSAYQCVTSMIQFNLEQLKELQVDSFYLTFKSNLEKIHSSLVSEANQTKREVENASVHELIKIISKLLIEKPQERISLEQANQLLSQLGADQDQSKIKSIFSGFLKNYSLVKGDPAALPSRTHYRVNPMI